MMVRILKDGDERLNQVSDFEVQTINGESGEIIDSDWYNDTTFNSIFNNFESKHRKGLEISVLDYGDELRAVVTAHAKSVIHHYAVLMLE